MSGYTKSPVGELVEQAMKQYEQALQTGLKLQEEASKWWTGFMAQTADPADWKQRWSSTAIDTIPLVQKRMEESLRLLEQGSRTSLDLMKQALEIASSSSSADAQSKVQELWAASLQALRSNAKAVSEANAKVAESWMQLFSRDAETSTSKRKPA